MGNFVSKYLHWIILISLALIWGSSFILMKRSLEYFTALELGALRISFASLSLLPFAFKRMKGLTINNWVILIIVGIIGNTMPAFLFAYAQTGIPSSQAGILNSTTPLFALIVGLVFYRIRVIWLNVLGVLIGLIGAVMIIYGQSDGNIEFNYYFSSFVLLASILYAINLNIVKNHLNDVDPFTIAVISYLVLLGPILIYLFMGTPFLQTMQKPESWIGLIYPAVLGILGSAIAISMFNILIKMKSVLFAASVTYMIPIVALFFGLMDGEIFAPINFLWVAFIITGVLLVNKKKS